jgi:lipopolysaccharide transport system permease protein
MPDSDLRPVPNRELRGRVIVPPVSFPIPDFRELWTFRDLFFRFAHRDLRLRYRQTALGVVWVVLQPLLAAGIFSFVFGRVAKLGSDGVPYFVFSYVGMVSWNLFSQCVVKVSGSLVGNAQLISKVFFPRLILPLSTLGSTWVDLGVSCAMGVVIVGVGGVIPGFGLFVLPLWFASATLMGTGVGLVAAALMVSYRDVAYILPVAMQLLLYGTPIAYPVDAVPRSMGWVVVANPLAGLVEGTRWSVFSSAPPSFFVIAYSVVSSVCLFLFGCVVFTRMERRFADVI